MKLLFDFFPLLVFFAGWGLYDLYVATAGAMAATALQVAWSWLKHRKVERMLWINFFAILLFGGLTLLLQDKRFIMLKPTIVYWLMAGALLVAHAGFGKNPLHAMMGTHFDAPRSLWARWLYAYVAFFAVLGVINLLVAYNFSETVWVNFKVFGALALTLVLIGLQIWTLMPYARQDEPK